MAMGQAAGVAAGISVRDGTPPRKINVWMIQRELLGQNAMLIYFKDLKPGDAHYEAAQFFAVRRFLGPDNWDARLTERVSDADAKQWIQWAGVDAPPAYKPGKTTRGELLGALFALVRRLPAEKMDRLRGKSQRAREK